MFPSPQPEGGTITLVDSHAHLVTPDVERYPPAPLGGGPLTPGALDNHLTGEELLAAMDRLGVSRAVVVQRAHVYGFDNRYVTDTAERYRARLVAVVCVDGTATDAGERAAEWFARGAAGVRFSARHGETGTDWFAGERARAIWRAATVAGASVCLHLLAPARDEGLRALVPLLERFAGVAVVIDHAGSPDHAAPDFGLAPLAALAGYAQFRVKISTINFQRVRSAGRQPAGFVRAVVDRFGAKRVMWGSDIAQTSGTYDEFVAAAHEAAGALDASERAAVLGDTAANLYFGAHGNL